MSIFAATIIAALAAGSAVQEPGTARVPGAVTALAGCWQGTGTVMGKPVTIRLTARPAAENARFLIETESQATADPADRYAAHLIFGGKSDNFDHGRLLCSGVQHLHFGTSMPSGGVHPIAMGRSSTST